MKLSLVTITLTFIINVISISAQTPQACNGYAELCSKAYSDVAYATTHNAYSYIRSSIAANQIFDVPTQLRDGIRGLMLDGNTKTNVPGIELCHGQCNFLDAGPAIDLLRNITKFLQNNPNEVLTIFWENIGNHNATEYQQIYSDSGLLQYAYTQTVNSSWPTLTEMIQSGKRVVNYIDNGYDPNVPWLMREYDFTFEIPFENSDLNAWMCTVDRPKNQPRPMYVLNHFLSGTPSINGIKISLPQPNSANVSNGRNLETHAKTCEQTFKKIPNYVAVDFYEEGSDNVNVFSVVAELNNVTYTPKQLGDGTTVANSTSGTNSSSTSPSTTSHNASTIVLPRLFEPFSLILSIFLFFFVCILVD